MRKLASLFMTLLIASCSDDGSRYPWTLTDLVDAYVNEDSVVEYITTDSNNTYYAINSIVGNDLTTDSTYRALCIYLPDETNSTFAKLYQVKLIFADKPIHIESELLVTDPLTVQSLWRSGQYLNLLTLPMAQNIAHTYAFVEDSVRKHTDGSTHLHLTLYHNQNGDVEAYSQKTYLSVPLADYCLQQGDTLHFSANTYDDGLCTWNIAY